jgi:deoxyribodipyrimidine photolyase
LTVISLFCKSEKSLRPLEETWKMNSIVWFRKGLRLHDNPALLAALEGAKHVYPVFILDPHFLKPDPSAPSPGSTRVGINRIQFLLQSLQVQPRPLVLHTILTCITTR